ncbi:hypothetical protein FRB94_014638 [Tulasnella sp. JGI-2019a]|nr:hypothetical protein FRB93_011044 [Tulasnella sp. JGI-2019a]KAG8989130.1 hypothetical protein FRB94_014638 [Tulasnella sp. JGI-2019a]KAG9023152.1 hypothetical protein FRB95_013482 [Tulasnella sp. JGI-2019a]
MPHPHLPNLTSTALGRTLINEQPTLQLSKSPLVVISAPGKPVIYGKSYTIYEGVYGQTQSKVAIKRLRVLGGDPRHVQEKIDRELNIRFSLKHKNILPLCDKIKISAEFYLIYPWMEHRDLARFLTARREHLDLSSSSDHLISAAMLTAFLDFDERNTIHGIASGIAYLHTYGVVHGDIKGENILLDPLLQPLISDFGLTKTEAIDATATSMGSGTPRWTSPELIDSDTPQKTKESDMYAFAMTMVEVLTGRVPLHYLISSFQVYKAIAVDNQRPSFEPLSYNGKDFTALWELAALCWQKNPQDRRDAADIVKRLGLLVHNPIECNGSIPSDSRSPIAADEQGGPSNLYSNLSPNFMSTRGRDSTCAMPQLSLSLQDPCTVSILPPGKPISFGNCDLFRGVHRPTQTILAMKRPRIRGDTGTQVQTIKRRFSREAKIWSGLNHINILPFYGIVDLGSEAYLVSPWVEQGDLSKFLTARMDCNQASDAFPAFDEASMIRGIALGLAYLHAHKVIHGDLKAANVLLGNPISPLICDFGLTKNEEFDVTSEATKHSGTARWMCPTVISGSRRTEKTDMFSFGMTIVEILTGQHAFPLLSKFNVQLAFLQGTRPPFEPLYRSGKNLVTLWELAALCWKQDPSDRPDAKEVGGILASLEHTSSSKINCHQRDPNHRICNSHDSSSYNLAGSAKRHRSYSPEPAEKRQRSPRQSPPT